MLLNHMKLNITYCDSRMDSCSLYNKNGVRCNVDTIYHANLDGIPDWALFARTLKGGVGGIGSVDSIGDREGDVARAVSVALAVLAAKEMVREAYRRGEKVVIPLLHLAPQQLSHTLPFHRLPGPLSRWRRGCWWMFDQGHCWWRRWRRQWHGTGLIGGCSLDAAPTAVSGRLALTATVATKSQRRRLAVGAAMAEGVGEREQINETLCWPVAQRIAMRT
jgi:hypothetical protein